MAAAFQNLFAPWAADAYAAARFASVIFTVIGLTSCGMAGFNFLGRPHGRSVVLILIGCAGLLQMAHLMGGVSPVFAALGMVLYGFSLAHRRVIAAALLMGGGWALLSVSAGFLLPLALMLTAAALPISRQWRFKRYYVTLIGALAVALPLMTVYPLALRSARPDLFAVWLDSHFWGRYGGLTDFQTAFNLFYYLRNLLWFAFPAWPLAVWTLTRTGFRNSRWGVLSTAWLAVAGMLLVLNPHTYQDNLVWLLPPLALLGAAQLDGLRRGAAAFLNWFGIMAFGLFAAFLWIGFFAMNFGFPAKLAERAAYFSPFYTPDIAPMPMVVAILFTPLWLLAITRKNIRGRQAVTNWAAGVTLAWALLMTLFLPWLDAAKSYRTVVQQMEAALTPQQRAQFSDGQECIGTDANDQRTRIAWTQYSKLPLSAGNDGCRYRLVRQPKDTAAPAGWTKLWQGARPRNKVEGFALLERGR
ncbi:glycosyltransferase family 39 protein [Neisseria chenwenguii]|nr:glycosyltransferase family 39 protein [Neisseria chenwenguii]